MTKLRIWWHRLRRGDVVVRDGLVYGFLTRSEYQEGDRCIRIPDEVDWLHRFAGWGFIYSDTVHPDLRWSAEEAMTYYESTGTKIARVHATRLKNGVWLEGDTSPLEDVPDGPMVLSGDWRTVPGLGLSLIAVLYVGGI